jgi:endonuclease/exonuclease/phosphatase family metal-dependent hydrolase
MSRLKLASYNIHQCVGLDGRRDVRRIAAVLREIDADVLCLQEVSTEPGLTSDSMQIQYLGAMLELHAVAGPTIVRGQGHYGNALLTRRPLLDVRHVDLTVYRREPRAAIDVDLDGGAGPVRVIATHLGLLPGERRWQVRRLLDILDQDAYKPTVLCGDINEWFAIGRPLRWLHARLGRVRGLPTFPAACPVFALDRAWVDPPSAVRGVRVHATAAAREASDHLPVVVEIEVPAR